MQNSSNQMPKTHDIPFRKTYSPAVLGILLLLAFIVSLVSQISPFSKVCPSTDTAVFLTIANGMHHGYVPYLDFFDHKGPMVYFLCYIGLFFGGTVGIWLFELLAFFVILFFSYRTALLFTTRYYALWSAAAIATTFMGFYADIWPENIGAALISISLFLYTKHLHQGDKLTRRQSSLLGFCFGASLLLKPNMFAIWFAFSVVIFVHNILKKQYKELFLHILYFILGCIAILAPFLLYLYFTGAFSDFIDQYILFNRSYASKNISLKKVIYNIVEHINRCYIWLIPLTALHWIIHRFNTSQRPFYIAYLLTFLAALFFCAYSGYSFPRYDIQLVPLLILPFAFFIDIVFPKIIEIKSKTLRYITPFVVIFGCFNQQIFAFVAGFRLLTSPPPGKVLRVEQKSLKALSAITAVIKQHTPFPCDKITVFGNSCLFYYYSNRNSVSKFIFQYPSLLFNPKIAEEYERDVLQKSPKLILFPMWYSFYGDISTILRSDIKGSITERFLFPNLVPLFHEEITISGQTVKVPDPANMRKKYSLVYEDEGYVRIYKRND